MATHDHDAPGTGRLEAYSDAIFAIIMTLLILEVHVPHLASHNMEAFFESMKDIAPKIGSFAFSFLTIAIFWVNHHHFFHRVRFVDWKLLWINNALLFWLSVTPFTTAFLGDFPMHQGVVSLYCFVMGMAALCFTVMLWYVYFRGRCPLLDEHVPMYERRKSFRRSLVGTSCYMLSAIFAFFLLPLAQLLLLFIPCFYLVPNLLETDNAELQHEA